MAIDAEHKGVEDVTISIYRAGEAKPLAEVTTDANGKFTLANVPAGSDFVLKAVKKKSLLGVHGEKQHVSVQAGKTTDVGNIQLKIPSKSK